MFCDVAQDMFLKIFKILFVRGITSQHLGNMITSAMLPPQCVLVLPAQPKLRPGVNVRNQKHCSPRRADPPRQTTCCRSGGASQTRAAARRSSCSGTFPVDATSMCFFQLPDEVFSSCPLGLGFFVYHPLSFSSSLDAFQHSQFNRFELHRA